MSELDWKEALRQELEHSGKSLNALAKELNVSSSKLSQVVRGIYPGKDDDLKLAVMGKLMRQTVTCPVKGAIPINVCDAYQKQPFSSANRERVRLYRACRNGCPYSSLCSDDQKRQKPQETAPLSEYYNLEEQRNFIKRTADNDPQRLAELYERELERLAVKYNQLIWKRQQ
ncbi:helix-turn-helix domain-containing protein [Thaumasiovibrio subtropicus]|uniref:helix-turn-helix domain-containing protein n=1 Tax=Thaumasiovibrio subtropicus TaxID=1891207 RepID=UPI000B34D4BF|nr:helix-turn-helix transcriptional regulator [Thaumasiovibrio subtropicus]